MGRLATRANMFLGKQTLFKLLLGRPWRQENCVDITKEEDGTYLVFKDPRTRKPRHKILVTPDLLFELDWDYDPSTWMAMEGSTALLIESREDEDGRGTTAGRKDVPWKIAEQARSSQKKIEPYGTNQETRSPGFREESVRNQGDSEHEGIQPNQPKIHWWTQEWSLWDANFCPYQPPLQAFHVRVPEIEPRNTYPCAPTPFLSFSTLTESYRMNTSPDLSPLKTHAPLTRESLPSPPSSCHTSSEGSPESLPPSKTYLKGDPW